MIVQIRELRADQEILAAFSVMAELRERARPDTFLPEVRRQQAEGYRLYGGFVEDRLVTLAGVRRTHTLARGEHLFVDDLVTASDARGHGHGTAMMQWLAQQAADEGIRRIYLDSRDTAGGFYETLGFTFRTSIPCWIDVEKLL